MSLKINSEENIVVKRVFVSVCTVLLLLVASPGFAKVTGLPDFTDLVEETAPAVVNIRVTQFGERARDRADGMENPQIRPFVSVAFKFWCKSLNPDEIPQC